MEYKIDHIIARVLSGESSSEDILQLSDWLNADHKNKDEFRKLKSYWDAEVSFRNSVAPEITLKKLRDKIDFAEKKRKQKKFITIILPIAASLCLLIMISTLYYFKNDKVAVEYYTYVTSNNISQFTLSDGTKVSLNKDSKLTYSNSFGIESRQVKLEGEGYFEVTKDSSRVFEVKMDQASIKVLGTKFNVKASPYENSIEATLVEGSIRFESETQKILLNPNQQLIFNKQTTKIDINNSSPESVIAWKDNINKYKSRTLKYLINDLEEKYHVKIVIENPRLVNVVVTGSFGADQTVKEALDVISRSIPMKWSKKDSIYYIR
jgi:ferric-dicitrate binding protein FerR (iron transport regulator)